MICVILGLLIWKKQRIALLHEYHYQNVRSEDVPAYTRLMGIGLILIGAGFHLSAALGLWLRNAICAAPVIVGFVSGLLVMNRAQKRYNGSWFS